MPEKKTAIDDDVAMVEKKEREIEEQQRSRVIWDAMSNGKQDSEYTEKERLYRIERRARISEEIVTDLADESLALARRVLTLSREIYTAEHTLEHLQSQIKIMKENAAKLKKDEEDWDVKRTHNKDSRREFWLKVGGLVVPIVAIVIAILISIGVI